MSRRNRQFHSKKSFPVIHFYCEGRVTEREYILDLADFLLKDITDIQRKNRIKGQIKIHQNYFQDEKNLVNQAINDGASPNDVVIVIVDEDGKTNPKEISNRNNAIDIARKHNIRFVYSIPCFEFWALLHFTNTDCYLLSRDCQKKLKQYMPTYDHQHHKRHFDFKQMCSKQDTAIRNAKQIIHSHQNAKNYKGIDLENPTTNAFLIIEELKKFITKFPL